MPFFWHKDIQKNCISKNNKPSLREKNPVPFTFIKNVYLLTYLKKRVSSFTSCPFVKAGMTLEAAFVLPIFLLAIINVISIMDIMRIKGCVDVAVAECGNEIAIESYGGYVNDLKTSLYIKKKICHFLKENLSDVDYKKIEDSIYVTEVSFLEEQNRIFFEVHYKIKPMMEMAGIVTVKLKTLYYGHNWLGYQGQGTTETMVFLSDYESVYHMDKYCKYLNVTIMEIPYINLEIYRNNSRKKYKVCNFCTGTENGSVVYITPEGEGYHTIKNCIGLKRSIHTVPLSQVKGKRVCRGCKE